MLDGCGKGNELVLFYAWYVLVNNLISSPSIAGVIRNGSMCPSCNFLMGQSWVSFQNKMHQLILDMLIFSIYLTNGNYLTRTIAISKRNHLISKC